MKFPTAIHSVLKRIPGLFSFLGRKEKLHARCTFKPVAELPEFHFLLFEVPIKYTYGIKIISHNSLFGCYSNGGSLVHPLLLRGLLNLCSTKQLNLGNKGPWKSIKCYYRDFMVPRWKYLDIYWGPGPVPTVRSEGCYSFGLSSLLCLFYFKSNQWENTHLE